MIRWLTLGTFLVGCGSLSDTEHDRVIYVRHDGADMMVWVRGNISSGVVLVMIHGGPGGESTVYVEDFHELEADYAIAYWDQRSSGASRGFSSNDRYTYAQFGEDLSAVITALDTLYEPTDLFVMGHSFGVEVGTEFVVAHPDDERVRGWMPVNGTHSVVTHVEAQCRYIVERLEDIEAHPDEYDTSDAELEEWSTWREDCETNDVPFPMPEDLLNTTWDRATTLPKHPTESEPEQVYYAPWWTSPHSKQLTTINDFMVYPPMSDAYLTYDHREELAQVTLPVKLFWGVWDDIIPLGVGEEYLALLGTTEADKELVRFENAYHSPMVDEQTKFLGETREFIEDYRSD